MSAKAYLLSLLEVYETQRILGKRAPGPAVTIIKNLKQLTDQCITGGPLSVAPAQLDPLYVDYAFIKGGEIPRVRRPPPTRTPFTIAGASWLCNFAPHKPSSARKPASNYF